MGFLKYIDRVRVGVLSALILTLCLYLINLHYLYQPGGVINEKIDYALEYAYRNKNLADAYKLPLVTANKLSVSLNLLLALNIFLYIIELIQFEKRLRPVRTLNFLASFLILDISPVWSGGSQLAPLTGYLLLAAISLCENKLRLLDIRYTLPKMQKTLHCTAMLLLVIAAIPTLFFYERTHIEQGSSFFDYYKKATAIDKGENPSSIAFYDKRFQFYPLTTHYLVVLLHKATRLTLLEVMSTLMVGAQLLTLFLIFKISYEIVENRLFAAVVAVESGFIMDLAGLSFVGNFIQATGNVMAFLSLLFFIKYLKKGNFKLLAGCALLASLTVAVHWLPALLFVVFYAVVIVFYLENKKHSAYFLGIAGTILVTYAIFILTNHSGKDLSQIISLTYIQRELFPLKDILYTNVIPSGGLRLSNFALLGVSLIGVMVAIKERLARLIHILFGLSLVGYLLLNNYLIIFYSDRFLLYTNLFFAFFTAYGAYYLVKTTVVGKKISMGGVLLVSFTGLLLATNIIIQLNSINLAASIPQGISTEDRTAVFWLKENSNALDFAISDGLRTEMIYGFTEIKVVPPRESITAFENAEMPAASDNTAVFVYLPNNPSYGFPSMDLIEVNKDKTAYAKWRNISYKSALVRLDSGGTLVFNKNGSRIYRLVTKPQ